MKLTIPGKDYIQIDDESCYTESKEKIHLIKLLFITPTEEKILSTIRKNPETKRYVVEDNIRLYNSIFKHQNKKYYVENRENTGLISFFKKNNKNLLNLVRLTDLEKNFILENLQDVLRNLEVIKVPSSIFKIYKLFFETWNGNVIIHDPENL